jgi:hypothetical protein
MLLADQYKRPVGLFMEQNPDLEKMVPPQPPKPPAPPKPKPGPRARAKARASVAQAASAAVDGDTIVVMPGDEPVKLQAKRKRADTSSKNVESASKPKRSRKSKLAREREEVMMSLVKSHDGVFEVVPRLDVLYAAHVVEKFPIAQPLAEGRILHDTLNDLVARKELVRLMLSASSATGVSQYRAVVVLPEIDTTTNAKVLEIQERVQEISKLSSPEPIPILVDQDFAGIRLSNSSIREGDIPAWIRQTPMTAVDDPIPTLARVAPFSRKPAAPQKKKDTTPSLYASGAPDTSLKVIPNGEAKDDAVEGSLSPYC